MPESMSSCGEFYAGKQNFALCPCAAQLAFPRAGDPGGAIAVERHAVHKCIDQNTKVRAS